MLEIVKQAARDKGLVYKEALSTSSLNVLCQVQTPSGIVVGGLGTIYAKPYIGSDESFARQAREYVLAKLRDDELVADSVEAARVLSELVKERGSVLDLVGLDLFAGQEPEEGEEFELIEPSSPVAREALDDYYSDNLSIEGRKL